MREDFTTVTATLQVWQEGSTAHGYVQLTSGAPYRVASLQMDAVALSETWREEFRALCQHIVDEKFATQGMRASWITPQARAQA
jgi:hypothetical protein